MTMITNTQANAMGIINHASGVIVTDATAASAESITLGFEPRVVRFHNITDRISDEWYIGLLEADLQEKLRGINAKLDADAGVTDTDYASLWNPASSDLGVIADSIRGITAKLDADAGVTDTNYASLWNPTLETQVALRAAIVGIVAKLDADGGVTDTNYAALWTPAALISLHTVAAGTRTRDVTNGISVSGNVISLTATTMVASKTFVWEAEG